MASGTACAGATGCPTPRMGRCTRRCWRRRSRSGNERRGPWAFRRSERISLRRSWRATSLPLPSRCSQPRSCALRWVWGSRPRAPRCSPSRRCSARASSFTPAPCSPNRSRRCVCSARSRRSRPRRGSPSPAGAGRSFRGCGSRRRRPCGRRTWCSLPHSAWRGSWVRAMGGRGSAARSRSRCRCCWAARRCSRAMWRSSATPSSSVIRNTPKAGCRSTPSARRVGALWWACRSAPASRGCSTRRSCSSARSPCVGRGDAIGRWRWRSDSPRSARWCSTPPMGSGKGGIVGDRGTCCR